MAGIYNTPDYRQIAMDRLGRAQGAYGSMQAGRKTTQEGPGKTAGGAIMSGVGGATAGASVGSAIAGGAAAGTSAAPGWGTAIGAAVGLGAYMLS